MCMACPERQRRAKYDAFHPSVQTTSADLVRRFCSPSSVPGPDRGTTSPPGVAIDSKGNPVNRRRPLRPTKFFRLAQQDPLARKHLNRGATEHSKWMRQSGIFGAGRPPGLRRVSVNQERSLLGATSFPISFPRLTWAGNRPDIARFGAVLAPRTCQSWTTSLDRQDGAPHDRFSHNPSPAAVSNHETRRAPRMMRS